MLWWTVIKQADTRGWLIATTRLVSNNCTIYPRKQWCLCSTWWILSCYHHVVYSADTAGVRDITPGTMDSSLWRDLSSSPSSEFEELRSPLSGWSAFVRYMDKGARGLLFLAALPSHGKTTVCCSTVQYGAVRCCAVRCCAVQCSAVQCGVVHVYIISLIYK